MDLELKLRDLREKILKNQNSIETEEATKNAFIMPFFSYLGYDVFDPSEFVPEFTADHGTKKGEKVDYAILVDGKPVILVECKNWNSQLKIKNESQLYRYFGVTQAKFAILTNGITYKFYTDLDEPNKLDAEPFFEFSVLEQKDGFIEELKKFQKGNFDVKSIFENASELKYTKQLKDLIKSEIENPSPELIKYFAKQVEPSKSYQGTIVTLFTKLVRKSLQQVTSEMVTERLNSALNKEVQVLQVKEIESEEKPVEPVNKIETTQEELESFYIIKSVLREMVDGKRIVFRDAQSYFSVLFDDNNRKPICRLYLNGNKKYIGIFDESKVETKLDITTPDDLFNFKEQLVTTLKTYL